MKADFTRDTFHPFKHFARVLTQQGRVQIDADMNEQAAILLHYIETLAADLIGPAGGPAGNNGFAIVPLPGNPNPLDFQIGFGNYYVNGVLCQADFIPVPLSPSGTANVFQVANWDPAFDLTPMPYFEVYDASPIPQGPPVPVQVSSPQRSQSRVTVQALPAGTSFPGFANPTLRRMITYLNQPDVVYSTASNNFLPLPTQGNIQVYLDVWERAITYAQDDSIREVALGGPDTAARSKIVWQVKWTQTTTEPNGQPACALPPLPPPRGLLQAMAKQNSVSTDPCIINPNAAYTGPENQLYRVEINRSGAAGLASGTSATFKWSRENGSVLFPIVSGGGTAALVLESLGRDDRFGLTEGSLVEVEDDRSVLSNLTGNLLSVKSIDSTTMTVLLNGTPDPVTGSDESLHPLLRRWDQTSGDPAEGGLTLDTGGDNCAFVQEGVWLMLEDGVQVQFEPALPPPAGTAATANQYIRGDYWLIPARTATGDVEWPRETDAQGNTTPLALPPKGIAHHYAPLAVISMTTGPISPKQITDCRKAFAPIGVSATT
jgi:Family of unknown function (DUF6519)